MKRVGFYINLRGNVTGITKSDIDEQSEMEQLHEKNLFLKNYRIVWKLRI